MSKVVEMGPFVLRRKAKMFTQIGEECQHRHLELEDQGEIVRCSDCKVQVSAWWALQYIVQDWERMTARMDERQREIAEAKEHAIHLIAARRLEHAWRSRSMAPSCPHCSRGILPTDRFGASMVNRDMEMRRREVERKNREGQTPVS